MAAASMTHSSGLGRKRKAEDSELDPGASRVLKQLKQNPLFSSIDWEALTTEVLTDSLPAPSFESRPFTQAHALFHDLFESSTFLRLYRADGSLPQNEENLSPDRYEDAAAALLDNPLWKAIEQNLGIKDKSSCSSAIDFIILTAIDLAQQEITRNREVDLALRARHRLEEHISDDGVAGSRVVLHHKIKIPNQLVLPELALHGVLDLVLAVAPSRDGVSIIL
ncbi:hypothetical protein C8R45DRAFT_989299 [Mycena sanguinolenta]|nr:hypothetical protein C8R45DRAFT_989299 [Mycena sanguinolenta]